MERGRGRMEERVIYWDGMAHPAMPEVSAWAMTVATSASIRSIDD
jgi:hypothetical protein